MRAVGYFLVNISAATIFKDAFIGYINITKIDKPTLSGTCMNQLKSCVVSALKMEIRTKYFE